MIKPLTEPLPSNGLLYFMDGQFLFRYKERGGAEISKYLTMDDVAAAFVQVEQDSGWMPAGVLRVGTSQQGRWYVYSAPAQKVTITVPPAERLTIPIPRTVMLGIGTKFYIWALKETHFNPNAKAYHAPFSNVHADGLICWGRAKTAEVDAKHARRIWDDFFYANFNNDLSNKKSVKHPANVLEMLRSLHDENKRKYPVADLVETRETIGQAIDRKVRN
ncbi:MAG: hypothetical protein CL609_23715 [Anaerolineaceae bacterium]|nr:hypothetical protein [Anaerolineaceae bacterium]